MYDSFSNFLAIIENAGVEYEALGLEEFRKTLGQSYEICISVGDFASTILDAMSGKGSTKLVVYKTMSRDDDYNCFVKVKYV